MRRKRSNRTLRRGLAIALLLTLAAVFTGCRTLNYYAQAVSGQCEILSRQKTCEKLLSDPDTPPELKAKLRLAGNLCEFASTELKLPANGHYRRYADLGRRYAVWNVYAARELSLESKVWWYPIVGSLDYRGFFAEDNARKCAAELSADGYDAYVEGVEAYSTLGWFKDPLLNTFIHHDEAALAEILFHELAHQQVFVSGDTDFNEAFATTVGEEATRRWLRAKGDAAALEQYLAPLRRNAEFVTLVAATRDKLQLLYDDVRHPNGRIKATKETDTADTDQLRQEKQRLLDEMRSNYEKLKEGWGGYTGYDNWFAGDLNNAKLNSVATYYDLVPAFERLLETSGGDLEKFYSAVRRLAKLPKAERQQQLNRRPTSSQTSATRS